MEREEVRALLHELFEEAALVIGGLIATYKVEDEFIWRLMRHLDELRRRMFDGLEAEGAETPAAGVKEPTPHPAVQHFLAQLDRAAGGARAPRT